MNRLQLNGRLRRVAEQVRKGSVAADIGTDHGYLAVWLVQQGVCPHVFAADVREAPLAAARRTVNRYGVDTQATLVLSDGLQNLPVEKVDDIVMAGMGGDLIADLIEAEPLLQNGNKRLILQPMTKAEHLRRRLYELGFSIQEETIVREDRFLYVVLTVTYTGKQSSVDDLVAYTGLVIPAQEHGEEYLLRVAGRVTKKAEGLKSAGNPEWEHWSKLVQKIKEKR